MLKGMNDFFPSKRYTQRMYINFNECPSYKVIVNKRTKLEIEKTVQNSLQQIFQFKIILDSLSEIIVKSFNGIFLFSLRNFMMKGRIVIPFFYPLKMALRFLVGILQILKPFNFLNKSKFMSTGLAGQSPQLLEKL